MIELVKDKFPYLNIDFPSDSKKEDIRYKVLLLLLKIKCKN